MGLFNHLNRYNGMPDEEVRDDVGIGLSIGVIIGLFILYCILQF